MLKGAKLSFFAVPFLAPREVLEVVVLLLVLCGEDKVVSFAAVLGHASTRPTGKRRSARVHAKNASGTIQATRT
jgi:hypothetical protein